MTRKDEENLTDEIAITDAMLRAGIEEYALFESCDQS